MGFHHDQEGGVATIQQGAETIACGDHAVSEVWSRYKQTGDECDRDRLLTHYLPLVSKCAAALSRKLPGCVEPDDLMSAGVLGLIDAVEAFEPGRGVRFSTFSYHRIRGAIVDELRSLDWMSRHARDVTTKIEKARSRFRARNGRPATNEELTQQFNVAGGAVERRFNWLMTSPNVQSLDRPVRDRGYSRDLAVSETIEDETQQSGLEQTHRRELVELVMKSLNEKERQMMIMYYYEHMTLKEIGAVLQVSESRVSQIMSTVRARVRKQLAEHADQV